MNRETFLEDRLILFRGYFPSPRREEIFIQLFLETRWLQPGYINEDGRVVYLPRLTANYGERSYDYSGLEFRPQPFTPLLQELKEAAEKETNETFNALILQLYRDGADVVNWHSDASPVVGQNPTIASFSFGGARTFELKNKQDPTERRSLLLQSGDLLVMQKDLQHTYLHRIPKEEGVSPRINLTFRKIVGVDTTPKETTTKTIFQEVTPPRELLSKQG